MNPQAIFCHNSACPVSGKVGCGNIGVHSKKQQRYVCPECKQTFTENKGTAFYRLRYSVEVVTQVITLLAYGCPVQAIVVAFGIDERTVATWQQRAGVRGEPRETLFISMRYYQQNYEQDIEYRSEEGLRGAIGRFHERHHQFYGYHFEDETIELVHLKVSISEAAQRPKINLGATPEAPQRNVSRLVYESATHAAQMPVYRREGLSVGSRFSGPAIIEEIDSTTFIPSDTELCLDENYNLILTLIQEG